MGIVPVNPYRMRKLLPILLAVVLLGLLVFYLFPVKKQSFDELYNGDPAVARSLAAFREYPPKSLEHEGLEWPYLTKGDGPRTLLFLHGMGGAGDI